MTSKEQNALFFLRQMELICHTPKFIRPAFRLETPAPERAGLVYEYGEQAAFIRPSALKTLPSDHKKLQRVNLDYIQIKGIKWFYNLDEWPTDFYADDGLRRVSLSFGAPTEDVQNIPGIGPAVNRVLSLCSDEIQPTPEQLQQGFSDCMAFSYQKHPPEAALKMAILNCVESIKRYINPNRYQKLPYDVAVEKGLIASDKLLREYREIRDQIRHTPNKQPKSTPTSETILPKSTPASETVLPKPEDVYREFQYILSPLMARIGPIQWPDENPIPLLTRNANSYRALSCMKDVQVLLTPYKTVVKTKSKHLGKTYDWPKITQDGLLSVPEATDAEQQIINCNVVAHQGKGAQKVAQHLDAGHIFGLEMRLRLNHCHTHS